MKHSNYNVAVVFDLHWHFRETSDYLEFLQVSGRTSVAFTDAGKEDCDLFFKYVGRRNAPDVSFLQATPSGSASALLHYNHSTGILTNVCALCPENAPEGMLYAAQVLVFGLDSEYVLVKWRQEKGYRCTWELFEDKQLVWSQSWNREPTLLSVCSAPVPQIHLQQPDDDTLFVLRYHLQGWDMVPLEIRNPNFIFIDCQGQLYWVDDRSMLLKYNPNSSEKSHLLLELSDSYYPPIAMAISNDNILAIRPLHSDYSDIHDQTTNFFGGIYTWKLNHEQYSLGQTLLFAIEQDFLRGDCYCWDIDSTGRFVVWISSEADTSPRLMMWDALNGNNHVVFASSSLYQTTGVRFVGGNHEVVRLFLQDKILDIRV